VRPGIVAAIPVTAMMALGTIIDQPVAAITLGVGAMLNGVAWRSGPGTTTPPLGMMSVAAVMLAVSTVVGTVTGRWAAVHLAVLFGFCLIAGLSSALGRRGAVVGTQTLIAFIVFGRFPESVLGGLRLAALVLAGGAAQVMFASVVASPLAWRRQRQALAVAYDRLAHIARQLTLSGVMAAEAFDGADSALAVPALFGESDLAGLITLVAEGRRIRLELLVISGLLQLLTRAEADRATQVRGAVEDALTVLAEVLELISAALRGADSTELTRASDALKRWSDARARIDSPLLEARLASLGGQVRAAGRHTVAVVEDGADRTWRLPHPSLGLGHAPATVLADLQHLRDSASLSQPAGRHAVRLAVVVAGTELLTTSLGIPRGYWAVVAAATVLRPNFGQTFTRGAERVLGTVAGAVLATLIAVAIDPTGWGIVATIGIVAAITFSVFSASFALGVAGLTALIVFLLHGETPDSTTIALDRGLDTILGGSIALAVFVLWPTWSTDALPGNLRVLLAAQRDYLAAVLSQVQSGTAAAAGAMMPLARHVRVAYSDADSAMSVARGEPARTSGGLLGVDAAGAVLAALRRVTYAIHALRLASEGPPQPHPELAPLAHGLERALDSLSLRLSPDGEPAPLPPLRALYRQTATGLADGVGLALDELVDAVNSAAAALDA
jgi:uncharacterized membrane protein YccC